MSNHQAIIAALAAAIAEAQALLEELKTPALTSEGWSSAKPSNSLVPKDHELRFAKRHGCTWNEKEKRDLARKWLQFTSVGQLALIHRRTEHSIRSELQRLLNTTNTEVVLNAICGPE